MVAEADLGRQRFDAAVADRLVAACVPLEVRDARDLEPDDERGVVGDALSVRLREADPHVRREREAVHGANPTIRPCPPSALAALIRERQPCVVLTGAGVSTESGIPDFRSATGIWAEVDPFEVASIQAFRRDPERVWSFYRERLHVLRDAEPNAAHEALAELERRGLVQAVVTQNIDLLHTRAGSRGRRRGARLDLVRRSASTCLWTEPADAVLASSRRARRRRARSAARC